MELGVVAAEQRLFCRVCVRNHGVSIELERRVPSCGCGCMRGAGMASAPSTRAADPISPRSALLRAAQIVEAKEAGAAGLIGVIAQVGCSQPMAQLRAPTHLHC